MFRNRLLAALWVWIVLLLLICIYPPWIVGPPEEVERGLTPRVVARRWDWVWRLNDPTRVSVDGTVFLIEAAIATLAVAGVLIFSKARSSN